MALKRDPVQRALASLRRVNESTSIRRPDADEIAYAVRTLIGGQGILELRHVSEVADEYHVRLHGPDDRSWTVSVSSTIPPQEQASGLADEIHRIEAHYRPALALAKRFDEVSALVRHHKLVTARELAQDSMVELYDMLIEQRLRNEAPLDETPEQAAKRRTHLMEKLVPREPMESSRAKLEAMAVKELMAVATEIDDRLNDRGWAPGNRGWDTASADWARRIRKALGMDWGVDRTKDPPSMGFRGVPERRDGLAAWLPDSPPAEGGAFTLEDMAEGNQRRIAEVNAGLMRQALHHLRRHDRDYHHATPDALIAELERALGPEAAPPAQPATEQGIRRAMRDSAMFGTGAVDVTERPPPHHRDCGPRYRGCSPSCEFQEYYRRLEEDRYEERAADYAAKVLRRPLVEAYVDPARIWDQDAEDADE